MAERPARTTTDLADAHRSIGFALGGEAGAHQAETLALPTSPDTILRRVKDGPDAPTPPPRYVGVDDWACRKGQVFGTILVDLERGTVIVLLTGQEGEGLKTWLANNPQVEVITRDRWPAYREVAAAAARRRGKSRTGFTCCGTCARRLRSCCRGTGPRSAARMPR